MMANYIFIYTRVRTHSHTPSYVIILYYSQKKFSIVNAHIYILFFLRMHIYIIIFIEVTLVLNYPDEVVNLD